MGDAHYVPCFRASLSLTLSLYVSLSFSLSLSIYLSLPLSLSQIPRCKWDWAASPNPPRGAEVSRCPAPGPQPCAKILFCIPLNLNWEAAVGLTLSPVYGILKEKSRNR